jgi:hypothetical protein
MMGRMGSRVQVAIAATVAALAVVAGAPASISTVPPGWKLLDAHIVKAPYPFAMTAAYSLNHPGSIAVRIIGPKGKRLLVSWSASCRKGVTSEANTGTRKGIGPVMAVMRFPFTHPDACTVGGAGRLDGLPSITAKSPTIRLEIQLLAHR